MNVTICQQPLESSNSLKDRYPYIAFLNTNVDIIISDIRNRGHDVMIRYIDQENAILLVSKFGHKF